MDNCKDNFEAISMLIDGELSEAQAAALLTHISQCETCKRVYDAFSSISDCVGDDLVEPPEALAKGIMFRINAGNARKRAPRFAYGRFTAIAACLVLVLFGASHFGLLGGTVLNQNAPKSAGAGDSEVLEESAMMDMAAPEKANFTIPSIDKFLFEEDGEAPAESADEASLTAGMEKSGNASVLGLTSHPVDNGALPEEMSFQTFLDELVAYADENDKNTADKNYAFFRAGEEDTVPVTVRIYEGEYEKPAEHASASNLFTAANKESEQTPAAEFADLENLRILNTLLSDAEQTDKTFDTAPSYTIAVFDSDGKLMDEKILPLRLWIHDGHIYFDAGADEGLLRANVKPDELLKLLEALADEKK